MAVNYNTRIATNGLVALFDAGNPNSINTPSPADHGYTEWYAMESWSVATYSIVSAGVSIAQRTSGGVVTTVVPASTGPTRGTIAITAGNVYYGVGGPINFVVEAEHQALVPLTMAGTEFWSHVDARSVTGTFYVYSPFSTANVKFFVGTAGGITGTPTSTATVNAGTRTTFTMNAVLATTDCWISSDVPIIVSLMGAGWDKTILSPMARYVYQRFNAGRFNTTNGTLPTSYEGAFVTYDSSYNVMNMNIADGSGGDAAQGIGYEYLSDRYSWGSVLSDYVVVAPYPNTVIDTYYWNGSAWVKWDSHYLMNGTQTNPESASRDATNGPGVPATNLSGGIANMASDATLWKWEGTKPFYLCINDNGDDEFTVLGWLSTRSPNTRYTNIWKNVVSETNNLTIYGGAWVIPGYVSFRNNQTVQYAMNSSFPIPTGDITLECWFNSSFIQMNQTPYTYSVNGDNTYLLYTESSTQISPHTFGDKIVLTVPDMTNRWCCFTRTREMKTGIEYYYMDGVQVGTRTISAGVSAVSNGHLIIGQEADATGGGFDPNQNLDGNFSRLSIYNRVLSANEVLQNFNAIRGRYNV